MAIIAPGNEKPIASDATIGSNKKPHDPCSDGNAICLRLILICGRNAELSGICQE